MPAFSAPSPGHAAVADPLRTGRLPRWHAGGWWPPRMTMGRTKDFDVFPFCTAPRSLGRWHQYAPRCPGCWHWEKIGIFRKMLGDIEDYGWGQMWGCCRKERCAALRSCLWCHFNCRPWNSPSIFETPGFPGLVWWVLVCISYHSRGDFQRWLVLMFFFQPWS